MKGGTAACIRYEGLAYNAWLYMSYFIQFRQAYAWDEVVVVHFFILSLWYLAPKSFEVFHALFFVVVFFFPLTLHMLRVLYSGILKYCET